MGNYSSSTDFCNCSKNSSEVDMFDIRTSRKSKEEYEEEYEEEYDYVVELSIIDEEDL